MNMYSFQLNVWADEVHKDINTIRDSGSFKRIYVPKNGQANIDGNYVGNAISYENKVQDILRHIQFMGRVLVSINGETLQFYTAAASDLNDSEKARFVADLKVLEKLGIERASKEKAIEEFLPKLIQAYSTDPTKLPPKEAVPQYQEQVDAARRMLTDPNLMMEIGGDPTQFIRDFGAQLGNITGDYELLIDKFNARGERHQAIKNALTLFLTLLGAYVATKKEFKKRELSEIET